MKTKKKLIITLIVLGSILSIVLHNISTQKQPLYTETAENAPFIFEGTQVTLQNGKASVVNSTNNTKVSLSYFGNSAIGDLNGDTVPDTAFLISEEKEKGAIQYYAVVAIKTDKGYKGTNAFLIGKNISPQSTYIPLGSQELQVNYATKKDNQDSTGATLLLKVTKDGTLEGLMK